MIYIYCDMLCFALSNNFLHFSIAGFDPNDPDGKNKTCTKAAPVKKKATKKAGGDDLLDLLDAGLNISKKKGGKKK